VRLGRSVVIAPHPDDDAIGCGGLISLLCTNGVPVFIVLVSDGAMSHPASRVFPASVRSALRVAEMVRALDVLGVERGRLVQMGYPDGRVPGRGLDSFDAARSRLRTVLADLRARTLIVPWRRDPHPDHRASSEMARDANALLPMPARVIEYLVWTPELGGPQEWPGPKEARLWRLDIAAAVSQKLRAVRQHRSQLGAVIHDDPAGFTLPQRMLARCSEPEELFFEAVGAESDAR
jgi:LmbE family N-acetylglucosaminyl deacetylase